MEKVCFNFDTEKFYGESRFTWIGVFPIQSNSIEYENHDPLCNVNETLTNKMSQPHPLYRE